MSRYLSTVEGTSYTSYGRILFKASAKLFCRIHVDKQNSFISEKCDFAGLWELGPYHETSHSILG